MVNITVTESGAISALERKKCAGARHFAGPPASPFPTLVMYVDDS